MNKQEFIDQVIDEVKQLKLHAKPEEIAQLNLDMFDPNKSDRCIYGQLTGDCGSDRAKELMDACCVLIWDFKDFKSGLNEDDINFLGLSPTFSSVKKYITYNNREKLWDIFGYRKFIYLSALEGYIGLKGAKIKNIFDYLQNKTNVLTL